MATNVITRFNRSLRQLDGVLLAIVLILVALALVVPAQVPASLGFTLGSLVQVAPFLVLSIAIAAYAQASGADNLISRAFQGRIGGMVVVASLFGAFSPFCSCGVIPLIAALLSMGVPVAAVMAFWLSSPLMDPSMFVLSVGTLGLQFAIAKTIATVGIGLLGGFGTLALMRAGIATPIFEQPLKDGAGNGGCGGRKVRQPQPVVWRFWQAPPAGANVLAGGRAQRLVPRQVAGPGLLARKPHAHLRSPRLDSNPRWRQRPAGHRRCGSGGDPGLPQRLRGPAAGAGAHRSGHGPRGWHGLFTSGRSHQHSRHDCGIRPSQAAPYF